MLLCTAQTASADLAALLLQAYTLCTAPALFMPQLWLCAEGAPVPLFDLVKVMAADADQ